MTRNVLLMFSTDQPPDPVAEMRWHAERCAKDGATAVVTTRVLTGLTPGRSTVAFYRESPVQTAWDARLRPWLRPNTGSAACWRRRDLSTLGGTIEAGGR